MSTLTRRIGTVGVAAVAATGIGIAFAAWTTNGTGTGSAASRSAGDLVVTGAATASTVYPTGSSDVELDIENTNDYAVQVSSIALTADGIEASDPLCDVSSLHYAEQTAGWYVPANDSIHVVLTGALSMDNDANDACQDNTFTLNLEATGTSAP